MMEWYPDDIYELKVPISPIGCPDKVIDLSPPIDGDTVNNEKLKDWEFKHVAEAVNVIGDEFKIPSYLLEKAATKIADETGVSINDASTIISRWGKTLNDDSFAGAIHGAIRDALHDVLGTELSNYQNNVLPKHHDEYMKEVADRVIAQMYIETQKEFKKAGITHVDLYRGVVSTDGDAVFPGDVVLFNANAAESWTSNKDVAREFADVGRCDGIGIGVVFHARVPVERILSTAFTGFGVLGESEYVILNSTWSDDRVKVEDVISVG